MKSSRGRWSGPTGYALLFMMVLSASLCLIVAFGSRVSPGGSAHDLAVQEKSWEFERFDSDITLHQDGTFTVRETQVVNFTGSFHFINRFLSTQKGGFSEGKTCGRVRIGDVHVFDLEGEPYDPSMWSVESKEGGKNVHIEFKAANEQKGWIIEYRMSGAVIFASEYDRLYLDAVSIDREAPIKSSRTTVTLPEGTDMSRVESTVYVDRDFTPEAYDMGVEGKTLWFEVYGIAPYEAYTVDVAFPKGVVRMPLLYRGWFMYLMISLAAALFLAVLGGMLFKWWKEGRDTGAPEADVVRYEPPEDLKPAMMGFLVREGYKPEDVTSTIVDLAIRGKLIIEEEEKGSVLNRKEYSFVRADRSEEGLLDYEREILEGLFEEGDRVSEKDLKNEFYSHMSDIYEDIKKEVMKKKLFLQDPVSMKKQYIGFAVIIGGVLPFLLMLLYTWFDLGYIWILAVGLAGAGLAIGIVGRYMPRRTSSGSLALSKSLGFKEYLATAEREEMKFMTPESFQRNLPYAMVLGVADEWASKFTEICTSPPAWFHGSYTAYSTVYLAGSLSSFSSSMSSTLSSSPSSGGGGFGGGSAGGGFGGGGSSAG